MSRRPLVFVSGLTLGDYLLWNWSLNANHEVIALVSGLTLPPLALATLSLLVLSVGRLLARTAGSRSAARAGAVEPPARTQARPGSGGVASGEPSVQSKAAGPSSRKIAA